MRVCPDCGHEEHPMWRPRRSRVFCDYTKVDTIEWNDSDLYMKIKEAHPNIYFDGHFVYHITRTGLNVEKIEKQLYDFMKWGAEPQEYVDHSKDFSTWQQKLSDFQSSTPKVKNDAK